MHADAQASTKVKLGATAGLRLLPEGKADVILGEVRSFLRTYPFQLDAELGVTILDGGAFPCSCSVPSESLHEEFYIHLEAPLLGQMRALSKLAYL